MKRINGAAVSSSQNVKEAVKGQKIIRIEFEHAGPSSEELIDTYLPLPPKEMSSPPDASTRLCDNRCMHCTEPRLYDGSHKYGLGVHLAEHPSKAHQSVRGPKLELNLGPDHLWEFQEFDGWLKFRGADARIMEEAYQGKEDALDNVSMSFSLSLGFKYRYDFKAMQQTNLQTGKVRQIRRRELKQRTHRRVYTLIRCQTNLGSPLMIDGKLLSEDAMHGLVQPKDPAEFVDENSQEWDWAKGNSAFYIPGDQTSEYDSEYVVYQPWQIWPRYLVRYEVQED